MTIHIFPKAPSTARIISAPATLFSTSALLFSLMLIPATTFAASFQILEQSPAHLGKAFAGTASDVSDASNVFF